MYPSIRAGDVLRIESRAVNDVAVGDIAVCRRQAALFSHRVIAKGLENGRACILTRPDRSNDSDDGPTHDENLLGVVVAIERGGNPVPLPALPSSRAVRRYFALRAALADAVASARTRWTGIVPGVQENPLYRRMAKGLLSLSRPRISYSVRLAIPAFGDALHHPLPLEEFDVDMEWRGLPLDRWTLVLHLNGRRQPAAWARFARVAGDDWRVDESFVEVPYRGAGLYELLIRRADDVRKRGRESRASAPLAE
jgi:hypothetical protein